MKLSLLGLRFIFNDRLGSATVRDDGVQLELQSGEVLMRKSCCLLQAARAMSRAWVLKMSGFNSANAA